MKYEIKKGKIKSAIRLVAYGAEGIGKSTFASQFPDPLFIDIEGGTKQLDIARFPEPGSWAELLDEIDAVIAEPDVCQTLVIDTIDKAETMLVNTLLKENGVDSIEKYGGGYGKGYTALQERMQKDLINRLDRVIAKGVNVVLLAHAAMRKFESPEDPPFDRWELKVSKKVAPVIKEWADILLFMNYDITIIEDGSGKAKARGAAKRMMHGNHKPTYDAKNRYGLPDDMDLSFEPLKEIYSGTVPVRKETDYLAVDTPTGDITEEPIGEDVRDALARAIEAHGHKPVEVEAWLVSTGRLAPGGKLEDLSGSAAESMLNNIDVLIATIGGNK